jgi:4-hydroxy-2-oxoheptanedioate aldolase
VHRRAAGFIDAAEVRVMLGGSCSAPARPSAAVHDPGFAMRALDAGASGICSRRSDSEQARQAVAACRFPPAGYRSWAALGIDGDRPAAANEAVSCGVMIETQAALGNLEAILDVPGVDFAFVGPDDLAISLGHAPTTEPTEPEVLVAIEHGARPQRTGLPAGIYCGSTAMVRRWAAAGFRILAATSDTALLAEATAAARAAVEAATAL